MATVYTGGGEPKSPRPANPVPAKEDLDADEVTIRIHDDFDDLGRCQFTAFWLEDYLTPDGVRGQVFFANLADWVRRTDADGRKVTALDNHTHQMLEGLEAAP